MSSVAGRRRDRLHQDRCLRDVVAIGESVSPPGEGLARPFEQPRCRPDSIYSDGIRPYVPHRGTKRGSGLGKHCWGCERTIAGMHQGKRLRIRYERRDDIHDPFLHLTCAVI